VVAPIVSFVQTVPFRTASGRGITLALKDHRLDQTGFNSVQFAAVEQPERCFMLETYAITGAPSAPAGPAIRQRIGGETVPSRKPNDAATREPKGFVFCKPRTMEGTLRRVDQAAQQIKVDVEGDVLLFLVDVNSRLWFDSVPVTLRYFQPRDRVRVVYVESQWGKFIQTMYCLPMD
jgi:hypothetical protein